MKFLVYTLLLATVASASRYKRGIFGEPGGLLSPSHSLHSAPLLSSPSLHSAPLLSSPSLHSAPLLHSQSLHSSPLLSSHAAPTLIHSAPAIHSSPIIHSPPAIHSAPILHAAPAIHSAPILHSAPSLLSSHAHSAPLLSAPAPPPTIIIKTPVVHHTRYVAAPRPASGWW